MITSTAGRLSLALLTVACGTLHSASGAAAPPNLPPLVEAAPSNILLMVYIMLRAPDFKASQGKVLFATNCAACHNSYPYTWTPTNKYGKRFLEVGLIPQTYVGTDPAQVYKARHPVFESGGLKPEISLYPRYRTAAFFSSRSLAIFFFSITSCLSRVFNSSALPSMPSTSRTGQPNARWSIDWSGSNGDGGG